MTYIPVNNTGYGVSWNADQSAASKDAVYDKIESLGGGTPIFQGLMTTEVTTNLTSWTDVDSYNVSETIEDATYFTFNETTGVLTLEEIGTYLITGFSSMQSESSSNSNAIGSVRAVEGTTAIPYAHAGITFNRDLTGQDITTEFSNFIFETTAIDTDIKLQVKIEGPGASFVKLIFVRFSVTKIA
jgi:hypothetical protein